MTPSKARLRRAGGELLAAVERRATRLMGGLSPGGLHALLQGFAELAWEPGREFLAASEAAATDAVPALAAPELSELLLACCRLGHQPGTPHSACPMAVSRRDQPVRLSTGSACIPSARESANSAIVISHQGARVRLPQASTGCVVYLESIAAHHPPQASTSWRLRQRRWQRACPALTRSR